MLVVLLTPNCSCQEQDAGSGLPGAGVFLYIECIMSEFPNLTGLRHWYVGDSRLVTLRAAPAHGKKVVVMWFDESDQVNQWLRWLDDHTTKREKVG